MTEQGHQELPLAHELINAEDNAHPRPRRSILRTMFGHRQPRSEIVFLCQIVIIYTVIGVSLYNLTHDSGKSSLWIAFLGSCLGYLLPNPAIDPSTAQKR